MEDIKIAMAMEDLGDGLYRCGGDIGCVYPLISVEHKQEGNTGISIFEYEKYFIKITFDIDGDIRKNPRWKREYKQNGGEENA